MQTTNEIRNVAIIAHVDHGKTTIVDAILKQSDIFRSNSEEMNIEQILDSGDLEREKGITISAKNIAVEYKGVKINIIDTPGHADFGGEVERTINMAEACILIVDAQEGPMIQTKVVLKKALETGLKPIVVINKIDKKNADIEKTTDRIHDLFLNLATSEEQLEFPILYAIAREGKIFTELPEGDYLTPGVTTGSVIPLLDTILEVTPPTTGDPSGPFQMQITSLEFDSHNGRYLIGKITRGTLKQNDPLVIVSNDESKDKKEQGRVKQILVRDGLAFKEVESASIGEIVAIVGIDSTAIGSTLCALSHPEPLPEFAISPPSIEVRIEPNTSPFVGQDGEFVTARLLQKRLDKENELNVSLDIQTDDGGSNKVMVRGELQLSILVETLRREGYEFQVRNPSIIFKKVDGVTMEPLEELTIEVPEELSGTIIQELTARDANLIDMQTVNGQTFFDYTILTRNLLGLRNQLATLTKGHMVFNSSFLEYVPHKETRKMYRKGMLVSTHQGTTRGYALNTIQERGTLFVDAGEEVYEGMIIGVNKYEQDMDVNPTKERKKSGVRVNQAEVTQTSLKGLMKLTLDAAIEFLSDEEMLEVTPHHLRLRKVYLKQHERDWAKRDNLTDYAKQQMGIN
ncbi:GTP-binding protein [Candidatus Dojkabacteria bacterium]|uniref:GTP-binding protein n=1 Tax=Candidatus Dojkabacteria bacterium TaxID=2099670 RepID=A0A955L7S1_9BACT|nr:GTP-binding protein [Candidatus Dojkabacteria bacterium]